MEGGGVKGLSALALWALLWLCVSFSLGRVGAADESGLANQCSKDFQSVMTCLSFAQGKVETPTKECCDSVSTIRQNEPKCLCYILQQTKSTSGAQNLKSLGVQEDKLLQLPSACQLKNSSISDCPKLLGLAPNSPDAAIFTNVSSKATPTTSSPAGGTPSSASDEAVTSKSSPTKVGNNAWLISFYALPLAFMASLF